MEKKFSKGTPEQFLNQVQSRITQLESVDSSIGASIDLDEVTASTSLTDEVCEFLEGQGYDMSRPGNKNYASAVADYIDMSRKYGDYSIEEWYEDTKMNYPEDLDELNKEEGHSGDFDMVSSAEDISDDEIEDEIDDVDTDLEEITSSYDTSKYSPETVEILYDVADSYSGYTSPKTDSWENDTKAQIADTAAALGVSEDEAKQAMIDVLGFAPEDLVTAGCHSKSAVEIDDNADEITACGDNISADISLDDAHDMMDDWYGDNEPSEWTMVDKKDVLDSDGFYTEYTMYANEGTGQYICMFGDSDIYKPDPNYADYESDSEAECREWFDDYNGFADDDDIYSSTRPNSKRKIIAATDSNRDAEYRKFAEACGSASDVLDDLTVDIDDLTEKYDDLSDFVSQEDIDAIYNMIEILRDIKMYIRTDIDDEE